MDIKPEAVAIPKSMEHLEKGKYGPIFPKTPACYGFTLIAHVKPGRADAIRDPSTRTFRATRSRRH